MSLFANFKHVLKSHVGVLIHHKMLQCSQWNARWGLGLEPWGLKLSNFLNIFWILNVCLDLFYALCNMHMCDFVHYALCHSTTLWFIVWSWNILVMWLGAWNFKFGVGCDASTLLLHPGKISFETWVQIF